MSQNKEKKCINCRISLELSENFVVSALKNSLQQLKYYRNLYIANRDTLKLPFCKEASSKKLSFILNTLEELEKAYPYAKGQEIFFNNPKYWVSTELFQIDE